MVKMPNNIITSVNVSEKNRSNFINRQDLLSYIDYAKRFFKKISTIPSKDIANKIFTELKTIAPESVIKAVVKDGAYIVEDKLLIVSKNIIVNKENAIRNGILPVSNILLFETSGRKHIRNLLKKIPEQYIDVFISIFKFISQRGSNIVVNYSDSVSKNNFIKTIVENYSFAVYLSNKELLDNYKKYSDSNIVILTEYPDEGMFTLDNNLGIKKENNIIYQSKNMLKIIYLKEDEEFGVDYKQTNEKFLINDILYQVAVNYKNSNKKINDIIKYLDNKIW